MPDLLEIVGTATRYREREAEAETRLQSFALITLAEHRARLGVPRTIRTQA
jgi:hypothetical protein